MASARLSLLVVGLAFSAADQFPCRYPAPSANFSANTYTGTWYEIGRTQTFGGGFFQRNCVCTQLKVGAYVPGGDAAVENVCREKTTSGPSVAFNATLSHQSPPGHWLETPPSTGVNYTIIEIGAFHCQETQCSPSPQSFFATSGEDFSVEYDCREDSLLGPQYCVHILSRSPTMDAALEASLLARAYALDLNPANITYKTTLQEGCW